MNTAKTTREILSSAALFGFDTEGWAAGVAKGRRNAARLGKGFSRETMLNEEQLLEMLNAPVETAELAPAEQKPVAPAEAAEQS
jgi:hypothetical protein